MSLPLLVKPCAQSQPSHAIMHRQLRVPFLLVEFEQQRMMTAPLRSIHLTRRCHFENWVEKVRSRLRFCSRILQKNGPHHTIVIPIRTRRLGSRCKTPLTYHYEPSNEERKTSSISDHGCQKTCQSTNQACIHSKNGNLLRDYITND